MRGILTTVFRVLDDWRCVREFGDADGHNRALVFHARIGDRNISRAVSNLGSSLGTAIAGTIVVADAAAGNHSYAAAMIVLTVISLIGLVAAMLLPRDAGKRTA